MKNNIFERLLSLVVTVAVCVGFVGCKDKGEDSSIVLSHTVVILSAEAQNYDITINSGSSWTAESNAEWVGLNPNGGNNGETAVKISVLENTTTATRNAKITIKAGDKTANIVVTQKGAAGDGGDDGDDGDDGDGDGDVEASDIEANKWIFSRLGDFYLWNTELKTLTPNYNQESSDFLEKTLLSMKTNTLDGKTTDGERYLYSYMQYYEAGGYSEEGPDVVSRARENMIHKVKPTMSTRVTYNYTFGFNYEYSYVGDDNTIGAIVLYVIPGSAAATAGLKRGDYILSYYDSAYSEQVNMETDLTYYYMGYYCLMDYLADPSLLSNKLALTMTDGRVLNLTATSILAGPIVCHKTITTDGGKKVGYLMYNEFVSGQDPYDYSDETYNDALETIFAGFKSDGVSEFVLDLRYNGGGELYCSQILSSLLVRSDKLGSEFGHLVYNSSKASAYNTTINFISDLSSKNLNLKKVYVIGSDYTASASEMVISGLKGADVDVVLLGTKTEGKNVGMDGFYKEFGDYGYEMWPITFQIYNAKNFTDYAAGFNPDYTIDEWEYDWAELGDKSEVLLGTALDLIDGKTPAVAGTRSAFMSHRVAKTLRSKGLINHRFVE